MCKMKDEAMFRVGETSGPILRRMEPTAAETLRTIIAAKDGEIAALTAEVTHLAEKLAERDAKVAGSVGDDAEFRILTRNWREHAATSAGGLAWSKLVGYLDSRPASAPSVDRNSADGLNGGMHDSIFVKVWGDAGGGDDGRRALAQYAYNIGFADRAKMRRGIDDLVASIPDAAAPQPVDAAQAVPEGVYYNVFADNFYDGDVKGMGQAFYKKWYERRSEFPDRLRAVIAPSPVAQPAAQAAPDLMPLVHELRRAIGDHHAPNDCYATGPLTGDEFRDLVQCPACSAIAMFNEAVAAQPTDTTKGA